MARHHPPDTRLPFLVLASTPPGDYPHPIRVMLHPDGARSRMAFSLGPHAANVGGQVALSVVVDPGGAGLDPRFTREFDAADLHWVVPFLQRLQDGEEVTSEVEAAYRERHGRAPRWDAQERHGP